MDEPDSFNMTLDEIEAHRHTVSRRRFRLKKLIAMAEMNIEADFPPDSENEQTL